MARLNRLHSLLLMCSCTTVECYRVIMTKLTRLHSLLLMCSCNTVECYRVIMTRRSSTTTRLHSLLLCRLFCPSLALARCTSSAARMTM